MSSGTRGRTGIDNCVVRIGIFDNSNDEPPDWWVRLVMELLEDERYSVVRVVYQGNSKSKRKRLFDLRNPEGTIASFLLRLIRKMEPTPTGRDESTRRALVEKLTERPIVEWAWDPNETHSANKFERLHETVIACLDVLLSSSPLSTGESGLVDCARFGYWFCALTESTRISTNITALPKCDPRAGIFKVELLQRRNSRCRDLRTLTSGWYACTALWAWDLDLGAEKGVELILKELGVLHRKRTAFQDRSVIITSENTGRLLSSAFRYVLGKWRRRIASRRCRSNQVEDDERNVNVWKIQLGLRGTQSVRSLTTIEPPEDQFWADPFLHKRGNETYVFFELYHYGEEKGCIAVGEVRDGAIHDVRRAIDTDYHLSYPALCEYDGELFMFPETSARQQLEIWRSIESLDRWELHAVRLKGIRAADPTVYRDDEGVYWLFLTISRDKYNDLNSHLYIFQIDSPLMNRMIPHQQNPVVTDVRFARGAGPIFKDAHGRTIRPTQGSTHNVYGRSLTLCWIKILSLNFYEQVVLETVSPDVAAGTIGTHHFSAQENIFATDAKFSSR